MNLFPIEVPPLRARLDDIPLLAEHFIRQARHRLNLNCGNLTAQQIDRLQNYDWPGNIRELQNVLERAVIISEGGPLRLDLVLGSGPTGKTAPSMSGPQRCTASSCLTQEEMKKHERENVLLALERTGWKIYGRGGAAKLLGLKPTTLAARMKVMGIRRPDSQRQAL